MWTRLLLAGFLFLGSFVVSSVTRPTTGPTSPRVGGVYPPPGAADLKLKQIAPRTQMKGTSLEEAINFLRDVMGVNFFVDWHALEPANISRSSAVDVDLHDVSFGRALSYILKSVGNPSGRAGWGVEDGVIVITTEEAADGLTEVKVYDVRDLGSTGATPALSAGAGPAIPKTREDAIERLYRIITSDVLTTTWKDNGGSVGSIHELNARLVIQQSWEGHRLIEELLANLRASGAGTATSLPAPSPARDQKATP